MLIRRRGREHVGNCSRAQMRAMREHKMNEEGHVKLEILGSGCANCQKLYRTTEEAVRDLALNDAELVKVEDFAQILAYGVMKTPALAIDGKLVVSGRVPSKSEVSTLIASALDAQR
jgi:small redox-active disulfide protein 2